MQSKGLDSTAVIRSEKIVPPKEFMKFATMNITPEEEGEKVTRSLYVVKPVTITSDYDRK